MSENNNNVEESKTIIKNPGRVAWGKKLAKMSKELKEKKKAGKTEEIKLIKKDINIDKQIDNKVYNVEIMIGVGGLLVAIVALYLQYKNNNVVQQVNHSQQQNVNPYLYNCNNF